MRQTRAREKLGHDGIQSTIMNDEGARRSFIITLNTVSPMVS